MNNIVSYNPKVSVIIPVYNVEKYIERCARSLLEQSLKDIEYIFVDDCSPDNSITMLENLLKEYPERQPLVKYYFMSQIVDLLILVKRELMLRRENI